MRWLLFFVGFLFINLVNAQSFIGFNYNQEKNKCVCEIKKDSTFSEQIVLDVIRADTIKDKRFLACCYHLLGVHYYDEYDISKALSQYQKSIAIRQKHEDGQLWKSYRNIAYTYSDIQYHSKTIEFILKAFEKNEEFKENSTAYYYMAWAYMELGEYKKAITAAEKALKYGISNYELGDANNTMCAILIEKRDSVSLLKAIKYTNTAIELFKLEEDNEEALASTYNNKGLVLEYLGKYDDAIAVYKKSLQYQSTDKGKGEVLNNIAAVLYLQGKYQQALKTLTQSLQLKKNYYENIQFNYSYAANHENLAENYEVLGDIGKALEYYQLALINLTDSFRNKDINTSPKVTSNYYVYNKPYLLQALDLKAQAALKNGNINLAYNTYQVLDEWINEFYKDLSTRASKLTWIARAHAIYGNAIEVALMKDKQEKAFEYAEKAHGSRKSPIGRR